MKPGFGLACLVAVTATVLLCCGNLVPAQAETKAMQPQKPGASSNETPAESKFLAAKKAVKQLLKEGQYESCLKEARRISRLYQHEEFYHQCVADAALKKNEPEIAARAWEDYLKIKPDAAVAYARDNAYAHCAVKQFKSIWEIPNSPISILEAKLARTKRTALLIYAARELIKKEPGNQRALIYLARSCARAGDIDLCMKSVDSIDDKYMDEKDLIRAQVMLMSFNVRSALPILIDLKKRRNDRVISVYLACAHAYRKRVNEARVELQSSRKRSACHLPEDDLCEALCLLQESKFQESLACLDRYLAEEPFDGHAQVKRAGVLLLLGREDEVARAFESQGGGKVGSPENYGHLGELYSSISNPRKALFCIDKCIAAEPGNAAHYARRADVECDLWLYEDALEDCKISLSLDKTNEKALKYRRIAEEELANAKARVDKSVHGFTRAIDSYEYRRRMRHANAQSPAATSKAGKRN